MDTQRRRIFNAAWSDALFDRYMGILTSQLGEFPFRVAETPFLMTHGLRDWLATSSSEIVAQLSQPKNLEVLRKAVPENYHVPKMDELPNCVQVDFAITQNPDGTTEGRVVELQAFPSLYALMSYMSDAWGAVMNEIPGLEGDWTCFIGADKQQALETIRRAIVAGHDPAEVVLVDYTPEQQKTAPDFRATQKLFGVDPVCVTDLQVKGRNVFRKAADGRTIPVKRIYNRMVFDELEVKNVVVPFRWSDDLDISWCSHPNWYWIWSKFALPFLDHPAVPKATFLSELKELPADLSRYVLKPLFSFAGAGVVVDVTEAEIEKVPASQRNKWVLQEKIEYAPAITMPDGNGVKVEVRVMLMRAPGENELTPLICLVRLSRGKMLGVDFNKNLTWVGGSVGMWTR